MPPSSPIGISLLGLGVVGSEVARTLVERADALAPAAGRPLLLRHILVRDPSRPRPFRPPPGLLTTDPEEALTDPQVQVVVEVMGGERPAVDYIRRALEAGKSVVTANKEVMAKHGPELLDLSARQGVDLRFEASVGGGIPILGPLQRDLLANRVLAIRAIINGTTNYILTRMSREGLDFTTALRSAQALGYAEPDPTNDVEGHDARYKLAVLATLAFHTRVHADEVYAEGITGLGAKDFRYAHELGYEIKLLAIARREDRTLQVRVHPALVPTASLLAKVEGAFNAVEVEGDLVGRLVFHGLGAGPRPTASAVVGDILTIARHLAVEARPAPWPGLLEPLALRPMEDLVTRYYFRMNVADRPGVLAQIARILGDLDISIAAVIQKDADPEAGTAEIVLTTHPAREAAVREARRRIRALAVVREVDTVLRIEEE